MIKIVDFPKPQPLFQRSYETSQLVAVLSKAQPGQILTYIDLGKAINQRIDGSTHALQSARRAVMKEYGLVFDAIVGVGVKCLTSTEIVDASDKSRITLRRRAKSAATKLSQTDYVALDDRARLKYATHQSIFGAIAVMASQRAAALIGKAMSGSARDMPVRETLALFQKLPARK